MSDHVGMPAETVHQNTGSARDRLLDVAERLFMERGYSVIRLRDVADELGVRVASLYYHFPGGKQDLFTVVLERAMNRMRQGLEEAIARADDSVLAQLCAAGRYFLTQHKIDVYRMLESDLDEINADERGAIESMVYQSLMMPLVRVFARSIPGSPAADSDRPVPFAAAGPGRPNASGAYPPHAPLLAGSFLSIVQAIHHLPDEFGSPIPKDGMVEYMATLLVRGLESSNTA
jgi:AcrR family transcriptional regulator